MGIVKSNKSMRTSFSGTLAHAQAVEFPSLTATPSPSTLGRRLYVQPSPGSPRSSLLFSLTTTAAGLNTKKGTKKSRSPMVSTNARRCQE